jgi:hypothetical protein
MIKEGKFEGYLKNSCKCNRKSFISMHIGKGRGEVIRLGKFICRMHKIM